MLFIRNWGHMFVVEALSVLDEARSVLVELDDIFIFSSWRERFSSGPQVSDGCDVEQS